MNIDVSLEAIRKRYDDANLLSISTHNTVVFSAMMDNLYMWKILKELNNKYPEVYKELAQ